MRSSFSLTDQRSVGALCLWGPPTWGQVEHILETAAGHSLTSPQSRWSFPKCWLVFRGVIAPWALINQMVVIGHMIVTSFRGIITVSLPTVQPGWWCGTITSNNTRVKGLWTLSLISWFSLSRYFHFQDLCLFFCCVGWKTSTSLSETWPSFKDLQSNKNATTRQTDSPNQWNLHLLEGKTLVLT